jgi:hypothetical protein
MKHSILFTGHMIDAKDRTDPRFPAKKENSVREEMRKHLIKVKQTTKDKITGIASGACGGDILFHELCAEINIPTEIYLALPVNEFKRASVSFAGANWEDRFDKLKKKLPVHLLPEAKDNTKNDNVWERANIRMLNVALENGGENMTLIALWEGKGGDGIGGTEHMVNIAKEKGARVNIIDINKI